MAYKFQLGPAVMSGSLTQEGGLTILDDDGTQRLSVDRDSGKISGSGVMDIAGAATFSSTIAASGSITAGSSFIIGSADMDETDLEKLDGITNGAAAANKALVLDGNSDISGIANLSATSLTASADLRAVNVHATTEAYLASAVVADLTDNRIVFAGTGGALEDSAALTFDGSVLALDGAFSGSGDLYAAGAMTTSGDLAVSGAIDADGDATFGTITMTGFSVDADGDVVVKSVSGSAGIEMVGAAVFGGSLSVSGTVKLDGVVDAAADVANDSFYFLDSDGLMKRDTMADYAAFIAGDGLAAASGVLSVGVDDSSIEINSDALRIKADGVTGAMLAPAVAGVGLAQDGSGNLDLDLNELSAATVSVANDSIAIIDADDSNGSRKESIADLVSAMAGAGLTATNGVLSTDAGVVQSPIGDANATLGEGMNFGSNTFSADRTWTLPAAPSSGDVVRVKAPASLAGFDLIVSVDGGTSHQIDGQANIRLESDGAAVALMYVGNDTWLVF
ncbi:MAG: hypothetical protein VW907_03975 [Opitutae bacterium]